MHNRTATVNVSHIGLLVMEITSHDLFSLADGAEAVQLQELDGVCIAVFQCSV